MVSALRRASRCSSDPVCAMRTPSDPEDFLHGAACHCCSFASETSCEKANRFLDRRFLLDPADGRPATPCPGSSGASMPSDPFERTRRVPHGQRGRGLAVLLDSGPARHSSALREVNAGRRDERQELLPRPASGHADVERSVAVLHAIAGAKAVRRDLTPVWTMPGNEAKVGHLTGEFHRLVQAARVSVTCATYNFEHDLADVDRAQTGASEQPGVVVTVYVDGDKADASKVKAQLPRATVYRSAVLPTGKHVVSHAKFIVIDHEVLLLTSANFSFSAENRNVEFGLLVRDSGLAASIESTMTSKHGTLYELV